MEKKIESLHIGLVAEVFEEGDAFRIVLDDGFTDHIPKADPIRPAYMSKEVNSQPYSKNNAVALVTYSTGECGWIPARVAVAAWAVLIMNDHYSPLSALKMTKYDQAEYKSLLLQERSKVDQIQIECLPVPGVYSLFMFSEFFDQSYQALLESVADNQALAYSQPKSKIDMAYYQVPGITGFTVALIQKTRFTVS